MLGGDKKHNALRISEYLQNPNHRAASPYYTLKELNITAQSKSDDLPVRHRTVALGTNSSNIFLLPTGRRSKAAIKKLLKNTSTHSYLSNISLYTLHALPHNTTHE